MYGRTNISGTSSQRETTCAKDREGEREKREEEVGELGRKMECRRETERGAYMLQTQTHNYLTGADNDCGL